MKRLALETPSSHSPSLGASFGGAELSAPDRLVNELNRTVATLIDLTLSYKQAHWNVQGPSFAQLHTLFDAFAAEAAGYADLVAERAVALGGAARGTVEESAGWSVLEAFPPVLREERGLLAALAGRAERTGEALRYAIGASGDDLVTQDIYVEVARGIDKQAWMLRAHLGAGGGSD
jgi:starvation-inducible DNA-binding protein